MIREPVEVTGAPAIAGLTFRAYDGKQDLPAMVDMLNAANAADHIEELNTLEGLASDFAHLTNCDLTTDMLMIDVGDRLVGYGRVWWWVNDAGERLYGIAAQIHPQWRGKGIGCALLGWQEQRIAAIAAAHPTAEPRFIQAFSMEGAQARLALLKRAGYTTIRYGFMMVRPTLDDVPDDWPLPAGLEVRPVQPEHMRPIWDAMDEAFRDHWGHRPRSEEDYQSFLGWPEKQPHLWQVAWDPRTDEVAGMVLNTIFAEENARYGIKRGWTDPIFVRRPWRRQGLARALIMRSLKLLRDQGMSEAALGVDAENPNKALHLYESCGYKTYQRSFTLRKPLQVGQ